MWGGGGGREDRGVGVRGGGRRRAACARGALSVQGGSPILVLVLGLLACLLLEGGLGCLLLFVPKGRGGDERGSGSKRKKERAKRGLLFFGYAQDQPLACSSPGCSAGTAPSATRLRAPRPRLRGGAGCRSWHCG